MSAHRPAAHRPAARRLLPGLLLVALTSGLTGCSAPDAQDAPDARAAPAALPLVPEAPASSAAPPTDAPALLGSRSATLDDLRAEQALRPVAVTVPGSDRPAPVEQRTTDPVSGGLDLPDSAVRVAWWSAGASPGSGAGSVVLAAHVSYDGATGPFTRLSQVRPGARVEVTSADGSTRAYAVESTRSAPKDALDRAELFRSDGPPVLVLVTCGGAYDRATRSFADNVVVTAVPV